ncbi:hypothetical protein ACFFUE_10925 [Bergeyella porcorum]|uniref:hypothetical protein n=1 Tax=Bergeyella porcorum TaxID=1735111 RepID=UPI0035E8E853
MGTIFHRYEASVKLSNGRVVVYHNINTGLKKFHRFLCEKFETPVRWVSYSVRRKENKEIIGHYKNSIPGKEERCVTIFTNVTENASNTGVFIPIIFERNGYELVRNMFVINKMIINKNSILISIPEWLFEKITSKGKAELYQYYLNEKKHRISLSEINLSNNMYYTREKIETAGITGTEPEQDYP